MRFDHRVALVTGAGRGIGRAVAAACHTCYPTASIQPADIVICE